MENKTTYFIFYIIFIMTGVMGFCFLSFTHALSFLLGSLLIFLSNMIFLSRFLFLNGSVHSPITEIIILYVCEFCKMAFIILAMLLTFAYFVEIKVFPYMSGLLLLQVAVCFVPLFINKIK